MEMTGRVNRSFGLFAARTAQAKIIIDTTRE